MEPFLTGSTGRNTRGLLRLVILITIAAAALASRLFSVIRTFNLYWELWKAARHVFGRTITSSKNSLSIYRF